MTPKTKKIIAREGRIIFYFICSIPLLILIMYLTDFIEYKIAFPDYTYVFAKENLRFKQGIFLIVVAYIGYLIIRFITWTVKTLRGVRNREKSAREGVKK
jgi:hypothetical protein